MSTAASATGLLPGSALAAIAAATGLIMAALTVPVVRRLAVRVGAVAGDRADRWNPRAIPLLGGVAIFVGFLASGVISLRLTTGVPSPAAALPMPALAFLPPWQGLLLAGTMVFLLGLVDDLRPLQPVAKLIGQLLASVVLLLSGIMLQLTGFYPVDAAISVFWFVGITNAVNLLDNMDGLAGGISGIVAVYLGTLLLLDGNLTLALVAFGLAGSIGGFLVFNYPPARIFMGDSGSLFLGLFLAGLALAPTPGLSRGLFAVVALPVLTLVIPILDTTLVTLTRFWEGRAISDGGRDHTSHRLVGLGLSETHTVWTLWTLAAAGGGVALLLRTADRSFALLLGGALLLLLAVLAAFLAQKRARERGEATAAEGVLPGGGNGGGAPVASDASVGRSNPLIERLADWHARWPLLAVGMDILVVTLAYYAAYVLRWEGPELARELEYFQRSLPIVLAAKLTAFAWLGIYSQRWPQLGLHEAATLTRANLLGSLVMVVLLLLVARSGFSRGVLLIDLLVCTVLVLGTRITFRYLEGASQRWGRQGVPALILASVGDAELAILELEWRPEHGLKPVAVADPGLPERVRTVRGIPAFGGRDAVERALLGSQARVTVVVDRDGTDPRGHPGTLPLVRLQLRILRDGETPFP